MRFAVTGASGHLRANVVRVFVENGERVRAVDVRRDAALAGLDVDFLSGDVVGPATLGNALAGMGFVLHAAARISLAGDPDGSVRHVNVDAARQLAEAVLAAGVRRVVDRGLDAVILSPSGMVAPVEAEPSGMGRVLLALYEGRMPITVTGAFDWVDVRNVAAGLVTPPPGPSR